MSTLSTHVLDTARGRPAAGIHVTLARVHDDGSLAPFGTGVTDGDGRVRDLTVAGQALSPGVYQLRFATGPYLASTENAAFYPSVTVDFLVEEGGSHYHIPLLLSPFGYSTYRGS
jgi:5-hydroxyisourate hydrolase